MAASARRLFSAVPWRRVGRRPAALRGGVTAAPRPRGPMGAARSRRPSLCSGSRVQGQIPWRVHYLAHCCASVQHPALSPSWCPVAPQPCPHIKVAPVCPSAGSPPCFRLRLQHRGQQADGLVRQPGGHLVGGCRDLMEQRHQVILVKGQAARQHDVKHDSWAGGGQPVAGGWVGGGSTSRVTGRLFGVALLLGRGTSGACGCGLAGRARWRGGCGRRLTQGPDVGGAAQVTLLGQHLQCTARRTARTA